MSKDKLIHTLSPELKEKLEQLKFDKVAESLSKASEAEDAADAATDEIPNSNITPKKPWKDRQSEYMVVIDWLVVNFPKTFDLKSPKPLKRHIEYDIFEKLPEDGSISRKKVRDSLGYYTKLRQYRDAVLNEAQRYDLNGEAIEVIDESHKTYTQEKIDATKERADKKLQDALEHRKQKRQNSNKRRSRRPDGDIDKGM